MKNKSRTYNWPEIFLAAVYLPLACGMYYYHKDYLDLGIHFMYKFILAALLVVLSFVIFLIRTDLARGGRLMRYTVLISLPHLAVVLSSIPLWVFQTQRMEQIRRGLMDQMYSAAMILAMAGVLYVFGKRGLWLNLAAMLGANLITIARVVQENGFFVYLQELRTLIVTFAGETGPVVRQIEIHELTFALGVYLVYYALNWKECWQDRMARFLFAPTLVCYLSGFKRIGVAAMAVAVLVWLAVKVLARKRGRGFWLLMGCFAAIGAAFLYIVLVKNGIFEFLSARFGLDTMGRRELSRFIDQYYWIGPDFFGNGAGFVTRLFSDLPSSYHIRALHNDILMIYIDIGFWGFWAWMLCYFPLRVWSIYKWHGLKSGLLCLCLQCFVLATAATDNTLYYIYVTGALAICLMGSHVEEQEMEPCLS